METGRKLKRGKGDTAMNVVKIRFEHYENGFIIASLLSYNANVEKFIFCAEHNFEMAESKH